MISTAETELVGAAAVNIFQAATGSFKGAALKRVTIKAMQSTHAGVVRIFLSADGLT